MLIELIQSVFGARWAITTQFTSCFRVSPADFLKAPWGWERKVRYGDGPGIEAEKRDQILFFSRP